MSVTFQYDIYIDNAHVKQKTHDNIVMNILLILLIMCIILREIIISYALNM